MYPKIQCIMTHFYHGLISLKHGKFVVILEASHNGYASHQMLHKLFIQDGLNHHIRVNIGTGSITTDTIGDIILMHIYDTMFKPCPIWKTFSDTLIDYKQE